MAVERAVEVSAFLNQFQNQTTEPTTPLHARQNSNSGSRLLAANILRYAGGQFGPSGRGVELLFFDPDTRGPDLLRRFNAGAVEPVNARVLDEVRGYLLSEVKRVQGVASANRKG